MDARGRIAELLKIALPASRQYQTIAGFLLKEFGTIPNIGEHVEAQGWRFEIVNLDGRRIDKVLATSASDLKARSSKLGVKAA